MIRDLVSVIMPTVRPRRAVDTIRQTLATTRTHSIEFIVITEQTEVRDATTQFFLDYERSNLHNFQVLYQEEERGPIRGWNGGLKASQGEFIAFWADDLWPFPGWLDIVMPYFDTFPDRVGYVGFNDLIHHGDFLTTHYMVHRQYIIDYQNGVLAYPHYKRICNDTESMSRAKNANLWVWAEDAIVEHIHPIAGKRERDKWDDKMLEAFHNRDFEIYNNRLAIGFPNDFEPAIME